MEDGDLAAWTESRIVVVMEGLLCSPKQTGLLRKQWTDPDEWGWEVLPIKYVWDYTNRRNVVVEVVTFLGQDVADMAADWLAKYDVPVAAVEAVDFDWFCRSLQWRPEVSSVVDCDPRRFQKYGQKGYAAKFGGEF